MSSELGTSLGTLVVNYSLQVTLLRGRAEEHLIMQSCCPTVSDVYYPL